MTVFVNECTAVRRVLFTFQINANPPDWDGYSELNPPPPQPPNEEGEIPPITGHWNERLTSFQKLAMVKCFKEEKVCHMHCVV